MATPFSSRWVSNADASKHCFFCEHAPRRLFPVTHGSELRFYLCPSCTVLLERPVDVWTSRNDTPCAVCNHVEDRVCAVERGTEEDVLPVCVLCTCCWTQLNATLSAVHSLASRCPDRAPASKTPTFDNAMSDALTTRHSKHSTEL